MQSKAEQHFNETNLNGSATITWNLLLTYATNCEKCELQWFTTVPKWLLIKGHVAHSSFKTRIRKQKFLCKKCGTHCPRLVYQRHSNNHIIDKVKQTAAMMELSENVSQSTLPLDNNISTQTVMRDRRLFVYNKTNFHYLPKTSRSMTSNQVSSQLAE